jgi:membrane associated rhomboid family serine protease
MNLPSWLPVWQLLLLAAALGSFLVLRSLARPEGRWGIRLRRRFVLGVPWGTLLSMAGVLAFYLFVQGGLEHWFRPVVIAFRAWSFFYPLGLLTAGFAHAGVSHLTGNLLGTLVFGTLAEYAWGHFPTRRGSETFTAPSTNPFARILAFPLAAAAIAVFTGAFGLGPVIGFSGVVFAFAGFALVRYPIATLVLVVAGDVVSLVYSALQTPTVPASSEPRFSAPWWANIAIQGHALGFFAGIALGLLVMRRRERVLSAAKLWLAALGFAVAQGLWAVYTIRGSGQFVLFRALGVALVFVLAALVAAAGVASGKTLVARIDLSRREAAVGAVWAVLIALALVSIPFNQFAVSDPGAGVTDENSIQVRDYTVFYAEEVPNQLVSTVELSAFNETTSVNASGVIVVSAERNIWWEEVPKRELAFAGERRVRVGGIGWRDTVVANRTGWSAAGGPTAYRITLRGSSGNPTLAYVSEVAQAEARIEGKNVSIDPSHPDFALVVSRGNETLGRVDVPAANTTAVAAGITFERENRAVFAVANETRVRVATKEQYT